MNVLVLGANGQLGFEFSRLHTPFGYHVTALTRLQCDITDPKQVDTVCSSVRPDWVINCAAYTAVDQAEADHESCFRVNRDAVHHLAQTCARYAISLCHFSTDYVFSGEASTPYTETDPVAPLGVYGQSKWEGEELIRQTLEQHIIIRLSWVNGVHRNNFMKTMLKLARTQPLLRVVDDQYGCPTFSDCCAEHVYQCLPEFSHHFGTYHFCQGPATTWHSFAREIITNARQYDTFSVQDIAAITTAEYPTLATRPAYSVLATDKFTQTFNRDIEPWPRHLARVLADYYR